jgi:hypothetical protein
MSCIYVLFWAEQETLMKTNFNLFESYIGNLVCLINNQHTLHVLLIWVLGPSEASDRKSTSFTVIPFLKILLLLQNAFFTGWLFWDFQTIA